MPGLKREWGGAGSNVDLAAQWFLLGIRQATKSKNYALAALSTPDMALTPQATTETANIALPLIPTPISNFWGGIPRQVVLHTAIPERPRIDVAFYVVQLGDKLFMIAEKYGLRPETVLWGNYEVNRDNPQFLRPGQELTILPTDGVYYQ